MNRRLRAALRKASSGLTYLADKFDNMASLERHIDLLERHLTERDRTIANLRAQISDLEAEREDLIDEGAAYRDPRS